MASGSRLKSGFVFSRIQRLRNGPSRQFSCNLAPTLTHPFFPSLGSLSSANRLCSNLRCCSPSHRAHIFSLHTHIKGREKVYCSPNEPFRRRAGQAFQSGPTTAWESRERRPTWGLTGVGRWGWSEGLGWRGCTPRRRHRREHLGWLISSPRRGAEKEEGRVRFINSQQPNISLLLCYQVSLKAGIRFSYAHRVEFAISLVWREMLPVEPILWTFSHTWGVGGGRRGILHTIYTSQPDV